MCTGRPLFCGSTDQDQLMKIFKILGTPSPSDWPLMYEMPQYKNKYKNIMPKFDGKKLKNTVPRLDALGIDLLEKMLQPDPLKRTTAREAMKHPYFADLTGAQV
jgi:serine/threonine protein kinase